MIEEIEQIKKEIKGLTKSCLPIGNDFKKGLEGSNVPENLKKEVLDCMAELSHAFKNQDMNMAQKAQDKLESLNSKYL